MVKQTLLTARELTDEMLQDLKASLFGKPTVVMPLVALSKPGDWVNGICIREPDIISARHECARILNARAARSREGK